MFIKVLLIVSVTVLYKTALVFVGN